MKKLLIFGMVFLIFASLASASVIFEDYFDRPDSTDIGENWTESVGTDFLIQNNSLYFNGSETTRLEIINASRSFNFFMNETKASAVSQQYIYMWDDDDSHRLICYTWIDNLRCGVSTVPYYYNASVRIYIDNNQANVTIDGTLAITNEALTSNAGTAAGDFYFQPDANYPFITAWFCTDDDGTSCVYNKPSPPSPDQSSISEGFNNFTYEESSETINITFENYNLTSSSAADLYYNGTTYPGSLNLVNNSYAVFSTSVTAPMVYNNSSAINFNWNYTLAFENATTREGNGSDNQQTIYWNLTAYPRANITAYDVLAGSYLSSFTVSDGTTEISTTDGDVYFQKSAGTYEFTVDQLGYSLETDNVTFIAGSLINYTFNLYTTNSISINIYDESTGDPIVANTSIRFSSVYDEWTNLTNSTSSFYIDDLEPTEYQLLFNSSGYSTRTYTLTVGNRSHQNLDVYLASGTSTVTFTVYDFDEVSTTIDNVLSSMYRLINGNWVPVESKYTDIAGKVQFNYLNLANYRFVMSKDGYETNIFYLNPVIYDTYDVKLTKSTLINYSQDFDQLSIVYSPTHFANNNNTTFNFLISSPSGLLISYGFTLTFPGGSIYNSSTNAIGSQISGLVNMSNATVFDYVQLDYFYETTLSGMRNFTVLFPIDFEDGSGTTFISNRDNTYGMTIFERLLLITIGIIGLVGITAMIGQAVAGLAIGLVVFGYCVYVGFVPIWSVLPSMMVGVLILIWKSGG